MNVVIFAFRCFCNVYDTQFTYKYVNKRVGILSEKEKAKLMFSRYFEIQKKIDRNVIFEKLLLLVVFSNLENCSEKLYHARYCNETFLYLIIIEIKTNKV